MNKKEEAQPIRVILADDHAVVRAGIRQFMERNREIQVVAEAGDGPQAVSAIQEHRPDVAILDLQMPGMSGIEVTRWVRANARNTGVLILTAYDDDPYVLAALQAGANGYVLKTADAAEIVRSVHAVYEGKSALDPAIARKVMGLVSGRRGETAVERLTDRELEVLTLAARGYTNRAIGHQLGISDRTVQGHLARVFSKMQAASRTEAVMRAVSLGWLPPDIGQLAEE
ncbi:MAG TPA: response regulator transcription factor [Anaerolineales bacterium]|nr:response regulator transcription factor [Anaerolineales bacterium]